MHTQIPRGPLSEGLYCRQYAGFRGCVWMQFHLQLMCLQMQMCSFYQPDVQHTKTWLQYMTEHIMNTEIILKWHGYLWSVCAIVLAGLQSQYAVSLNSVRKVDIVQTVQRKKMWNFEEIDAGKMRFRKRVYFIWEDHWSDTFLLGLILWCVRGLWIVR